MNSQKVEPTYFDNSKIKGQGGLVFIPVSEGKMSTGINDDIPPVVKIEEEKDQSIAENSHSTNQFIDVTLKSQNNLETVSDTVPCYFRRYNKGSSKLCIYFHSSSVDLGTEAAFIDKLSNLLSCHFLAIEYPGYGACFSEKYSEEETHRRSQVVYNCKDTIPLTF